MAHPLHGHRPAPRRTSSSFLSAFANSSTTGSASSSSSPILSNPPPTSFPAAYAAKDPTRAADEGAAADGSSIYSDITHSTTLGGGSAASYASPSDGRSYAGSIASGIGAGAGAWSSRATLGDMLNKRLGTWDALRRAHQGTLYWSNTIHLPIPAIQASVEPAVFRSRPYAFSLLGMSLAPLLEIRGLSDVVVYTNRTLDQFDSAAVHVAGGPSVNKTGTMKGIFKGGSKSGKRPSVGAGGGPGGDASGGGGLAGDFGADFLMVYNQPFPPDYFQTLTSFFDILIELYNKLFSLLSPQQAGGQHGFRSQLAALPLPLHRALERTYPSALSPDAATPQTAVTVTDSGSTSWRYPSATPTQQQGAFSSGGVNGSSSGHGHSSGWETPMTAGFQSPPLSLAGTTLGGSSLRGSLGGGESVRQDVVDGITRLDARIRKITNVVMKELETLARKEIKGETSHLESLLSVLSPSDEDHFTPPSGLASASLWALGTSEADRAIQRYGQA